MSTEHKLVLCDAHEVVQILPLRDCKYKCMRCGLQGELSLLFSQEPKNRCSKHWETLDSGWKGPIYMFT